LEAYHESEGTSASCRRTWRAVARSANGLEFRAVGLFRRKKASAADPVASDEHAVITHLPLSGDDFGTEAERAAVHELETRIEAAVAALGGEHDGDEFGGGEAALYTYGPDADRLLEAIRGCLDGFDVRPGAYARKRYGRADDPEAREERVPLV